MSDKLKGRSDDVRVFYIVLIAAVATVQIALKIFTTVMPDTTSQACSRIMECVMSVCALFLFFKTNFVQPWFGLKVEKEYRKRTVITCLILILGIIALFIAARLVMQQLSPAVAERPFFRPYLNIKHRRYYVLFVLVQEILAKSVLQYGTEKTLPENKWYIALPVSALVFGMMHIYHTLYYMAGAVCLALVSGVLYHRQKNIWASFVIHFLIAFLPRCFGLK